MKFLLLFLLPISAFSQTTYKGSIINKRTKEKISFATIGLVCENTGLNADENGEFNLPAKVSNPNDTLIISNVGFETLKVPVSKLTSAIQHLLIMLPLLKLEFQPVHSFFNHARQGSVSGFMI